MANVEGHPRHDPTIFLGQMDLPRFWKSNPQPSPSVFESGTSARHCWRAEMASIANRQFRTIRSFSAFDAELDEGVISTAVFNGVLYERLKGHAGQWEMMQGRRNVDRDLEAVFEANTLTVEVQTDELEVIGHRVVRRVDVGEGRAKKFAEVPHHALRFCRVLPDQRDHAVERVEEEVWVELGTKHLNLGLSGPRGQSSRLGSCDAHPVGEEEDEKDGAPQPQEQERASENKDIFEGRFGNWMRTDCVQNRDLRQGPKDGAERRCG